MPEFCTCGARLPEDARFCHKCGKPQRDEPLLAELEAPPPPPPPMPELPPAAEPVPIGFHNRVAVQVALFTGVLGFSFSALTGLFAIIFMAGCGFFAVYWYSRRTGQLLSPVSGAYLGWITGMFGSLIVVTLMALALKQPEVIGKMKEQWDTYATPETVSQMLQMISSPASLSMILAMVFVFLTLLPTAGGAMGAFLLGRQRR